MEDASGADPHLAAIRRLARRIGDNVRDGVSSGWDAPSRGILATNLRRITEAALLALGEQGRDVELTSRALDALARAATAGALPPKLASRLRDWIADPSSVDQRMSTDRDPSLATIMIVRDLLALADLLEQRSDPAAFLAGQFERQLGSPCR